MTSPSFPDMKRILIPLLAILFLPQQTRAQVAGRENLNNDKCYLLKRLPAQADTCGTVYYAAEENTACAQTDISEDDNCRWAVWHQEKDDLYFLYNLGAGRFLSADGTFCPLTNQAVPVELYYLEECSAWIIECKGFTVGLHPKKSLSSPFLGDLSASADNGFLFSITEAGRTLTEDEKKTIGNAVTGHRQARIQALQSFVAKAEAIAADGKDNYAGTYDCTALKTALGAADSKTLEELENLYTAARRSGLPQAGKYYRLRNYVRPVRNALLTVQKQGEDYYMTAEDFGSAAPGNSGNRIEDLCLFRLEATGTDTVFLVCATGPDKYFGRSGNNGSLPLTDRKNAVSYRLIDRLDKGDRLFQFQNATPDNQLYLTVNGANRIVSYNQQEDPELWYFEEVSTVDDIRIGNSGYATLCLPCPVELPAVEDFTAYIVTEDKNETVVLQPLRTDILPAYTPVILYREAGAGTFSLPIASADAEPVAGNLLSGNTVRTDLTTSDYILADKSNCGVGLYLVTAANDLTLAANKAYLHGNTVTETAKAFHMALGSNTTGTGSAVTVTSAREETLLHDLSGRRTNRPAKGIFINSKKQKVLIR